MPGSLGDGLVRLGEQLLTVAARADDTAFTQPLNALMDAAESVARSWSGSNIGFHADVYYEGLRSAPPGAHFSSEWGFLPGMLQGTTGDWREYPHDDVIGRIEELAGHPDLTGLRRDADEAVQIVREGKDDVTSLLRAYLRRDDDEHLRDLLGEVQTLEPLSYDQCLRAQLPSGNFMSRDSTAISQGIRSAPHQEVIARVVSIRSPFEAATRLASVSRRAARHLDRIGGEAAPTDARLRSDGRIVIGHGRSPLWRELKDFISERLGLDWDEFNRVATAGVATADRLLDMLNSASMAFLVATAEDETAEGRHMARQNVIHEIGLFQARLGFSRAIILLEEGCEEFSNIHGLGQIRFPRGNIAACFEDVRRVVEREGLL
jgi:predicted nucleotide-binding protein